MTKTRRRKLIGSLSLITFAAVLSGCGDTAQDPQPTPSLVITDEPQSDVPIEIPGVPAPSASLSAPEIPVAGGIANETPETFAQFVPPDIGLSGIAVAVSSTTAEKGQTVRFASQAAPELTTHAAFLVTAFEPTADTLATGRVGNDGRFILDVELQDTTTAVMVIAQAGVPEGAPFVFDQVVARSENITITVN